MSESQQHSSELARVRAIIDSALCTLRGYSTIVKATRLRGDDLILTDDMGRIALVLPERQCEVRIVADILSHAGFGDYLDLIVLVREHPAFVIERTIQGQDVIAID